MYIICVRRRSFLANYFASAPRKKTKTPKGLYPVTVLQGGGVSRVVISGIRTSGGLLIRFARPFVRVDDDAVAAATEEAVASNRLRCSARYV